MQVTVEQLSVGDLFELSRPQLGGLNRSEQLQSLMCRLVWRELVVDVDSVVEMGRRRQKQWRESDRGRCYLDEWDRILDDPKLLVGMYERYDRELSGLYSNTPLVDVVSLEDRDLMLECLFEYRAAAAA